MEIERSKLKEPKTKRSPWYMGLLTLLCVIGYFFLIIFVPYTKAGELPVSITLPLLGYNINSFAAFQGYFELIMTGFQSGAFVETILLLVRFLILILPVITGLFALIFSSFRLPNVLNCCAWGGIIAAVIIGGGFSSFDFKTTEGIFSLTLLLPIGACIFAIAGAQLARRK